jgi:glycosyltransferase involved in cell wall biosynthesis
MRILYVCADPMVSPLGDSAASAHVRAVARALSSRGHAVTLACRRTDGPNQMSAGISLAVMPEGWNEQTRWMIDQLRRLGIDAVIERHSLRSGPAADAVDRWPIPLVVEVNSPLVDDAARAGELDDVSSWRRWETRMLTGADHVVAVSEVVAWYALACGVPRGRVSVVPNGVDPVRFAGVEGHSVRLEFDLRRNFVLGYCGSLEPGQGLEDVVEALALLPPNVRLLIVGEGPERQTIRRCAARFGVEDRVVLAGSVPEAEVPAFLAAVDAGIAPYTDVERFYYSPLEVLEYCAAGLPIVATAQGEMSQLGGAALTVPPGDPRAIAEAVARLAGDDQLRASMSRAARAYAARRTWEQAAERIEELVHAVRVTDRDRTRTRLLPR